MTKRKLRHALQGHTNIITRIAWSPDGEILASGSNDQTIRLWDLNGDMLEAFASPYSTITNLTWSHDGLLLAISSIYEDIYIMNARSGMFQAKITGHSGWVTSMAWSPDGKSIASTCADEIIRVWYAKNYLLLESLKGHTNLIRCVTWSPDGKTLASSSSGGNIRLWNTNTWKQTRFLQGHLNSADCLTWSPDSQILASSSADNTIRIWDPEKGKDIKILEVDQKNISCLSFSSDGSLLASMDESGSVCFWRCNTWKMIDAFSEPSSGKLRGGLAFNPKTAILAVICQRKREINIYNLYIDNTGNIKPLSDSSRDNKADSTTSAETHIQSEKCVHTELTPSAPALNVSQSNVLPENTNHSMASLKHIFTCPNCGEVIADRLIKRRQELGHTAINCPMCDTSIPLISVPKPKETPPPARPSTSINLEFLRSVDRFMQSTPKTADPIKDIKQTFRTNLSTGPKTASVPSEITLQSFGKWAGSSKCTLALVFTDILGSTKLCNKLGNETFNKMRQAHFAQASRLIKKYNGYEVKTIGDSVMAAFRTAAEALDFALEFHSKTSDNRIKIRVGVHVGTISIEQNDAFGITVNYTARVEKMGQGAEIWVSNEAKTHIDQEGSERHSLVQWSLHPDCELKGFEGKHTLWSVSNPEAIFI